MEADFRPVFQLNFLSAEFPSGTHRYPDDGVHGGDGERGEGDVLHQQIHLC